MGKVVKGTGMILLEEIFGWYSMRHKVTPVYGEQIPPMLYEKFDRDVRLIETREIPSQVRIIYE